MTPAMEKQSSTAPEALAQKTGRQHPGIIENQAVTGPEKVRQLIKTVVLHRAGGTFQRCIGYLAQASGDRSKDKGHSYHAGPDDTHCHNIDLRKFSKNFKGRFRKII